MSRAGEFDLIARLWAPLSQTAAGAFNLTDDAATLSPSPGCEMVITKDAVVAGVHFFPDDPPGDIARKALRVNLSDLAAKGAKPRGFFMALAIPSSIPDSWLEQFASGLATDVATFQCPLMGGDTTATPGPLMISITAIGEVKTGRMVRRNGARAGDVLCVSGTIGDAALGLRVARGELGELSEADRTYLLQRYRVPVPRLELGQAESGRDSASIDVSDGLCADVAHLCRQSLVGAVIHVDRVPLSDAAKKTLVLRADLLTDIMTGGDDYELAIAVPAANVAAAQAHGQRLGIPVTPIGAFVEGEGVQVLDKAGETIRFPQLGFTHR